MLLWQKFGMHSCARNNTQLLQLDHCRDLCQSAKDQVSRVYTRGVWFLWWKQDGLFLNKMTYGRQYTLIWSAWDICAGTEQQYSKIVNDFLNSLTYIFSLQWSAYWIRSTTVNFEGDFFNMHTCTQSHQSQMTRCSKNALLLFVSVALRLYNLIGDWVIW